MDRGSVDPAAEQTRLVRRNMRRMARRLAPVGVVDAAEVLRAVRFINEHTSSTASERELVMSAARSRLPQPRTSARKALEVIDLALRCLSSTPGERELAGEEAVRIVLWGARVERSESPAPPPAGRCTARVWDNGDMIDCGESVVRADRCARHIAHEVAGLRAIIHEREGENAVSRARIDHLLGRARSVGHSGGGGG